MTTRAAAIIFTLALGPSMAEIPPDADNILQRFEKQEAWYTNALRDYEVNRKYVVEGRRFGQQAAMEVRVNYSFPGCKNIQVLWANGSSLLKSRVLNRVIDAEVEAASDEMRDHTKLNSRNYVMRVTGTDTLGGRRCFVVELTPRERSRYLVRGRMWLDAQDAAVVKLEGEPAAGCSFWVHNIHIVQNYRKFGAFWLIAQIQTDADVRFYGPASLSIEYYGYQVNRSLLARRGAAF